MLVVEDDEGLALLMSKILKREGLRTVVAGTGAEAEAQLARERPR